MGDMDGSQLEDVDRVLEQNVDHTEYMEDTVVTKSEVNDDDRGHEARLTEEKSMSNEETVKIDEVEEIYDENAKFDDDEMKAEKEMEDIVKKSFVHNLWKCNDNGVFLNYYILLEWSEDV